MVRLPVLPLFTLTPQSLIRSHVSVSRLFPLTLATGPLGFNSLEILQEVEQTQALTTEKSKALYVDGMGDVLGVELM